MYQKIIEEIETIQRSRITPIQVARNGNTLIEGPAKRCAGLYFFYTSYSLSELKNCGAPPTASAVPISSLAKNIGALAGIKQQEDDGFRLVYNGVGGFSGSSYDLRSRILQEISSNDPRTGSLCIRQTPLNDLDKWRFSYVILPTSNFESEVDPDVGEQWDFQTEALNLEMYWRLHLGWPLLSRK
ncbi:hypothetical protein V1358_03615 [Pseudoalteromonas sp. YIC-656]|uniref:hypothetical protein n=1 Tax=Pseudoalteromonas pernae TaxID=3118054 RepID=UPI0032421A78